MPNIQRSVFDVYEKQCNHTYKQAAVLNCYQRFKSKSDSLHINFECDVFDTKFRAQNAGEWVYLSFSFDSNKSFDAILFYLCCFL